MPFFMLKIDLSRDAARFLKKIPAGHSRQIAERILALTRDPDSLPSVELKGYAPWRRAKSGEYRIIYNVEDGTLFVLLIGKRNDDEVYQLLKRSLR